MNERIHDILADGARWAKEAVGEWIESVQDSPPAHVYTLIVGVTLTLVTGMIL